MTCSICDSSPALRVVGQRGFCRDHIPEAYEAMKDKRQGFSLADPEKMKEYQKTRFGGGEEW